VEEPPVTLPVTWNSELPFGQLVPAWFSLMETVVVPLLGLQVIVPLPVAKAEDAPVPFLSFLFLGVHFDTVKFPAIVPLSFLHATPDAAAAGVAEPTTTSEAGKATAVTDATTRDIRRIRLPPHIHE
jgi:hypothetical protein